MLAVSGVSVVLFILAFINLFKENPPEKPLAPFIMSLGFVMWWPGMLLEEMGLAITINALSLELWQFGLGIAIVGLILHFSLP